ncbi:hypothetical protein Tsubulata_042835 [Turnera subulata]|uniref:Uncharacterized protein n=1 Tax=Turnera subulata TaxID=218843 RepID=A0A9Q0GFV9_9ROSI|nr:hypothetical protein Tsubulata_042835 [Turnera subulata]
MANSRIAKFILEVAPPQYINVMRHRTSKMMDTIVEDDREVSANDPLASAPKSTSSARVSSSVSANSVAATDSKYFFRGIERTLFNL